MHTDFVLCLIYTFLTCIKNALHMGCINVYYINAYMVMFIFLQVFVCDNATYQFGTLQSNKLK